MWYKPANESSVATPSMLLFPDRIKENIRRMIHMAGSAERLRPHVKTHKLSEVIELQLQQGISRFKCATLSEVAMVSDAGGVDILLAYPNRTLCPGTPLLWDAGYERTIPDLDFLPAAVVAGRVISKAMGQVCLDLGYKSIASEMAHPRLHFLELETNEVINHSEEHLVLRSNVGEHLSIGDVVYALPSHICPTMALHEEVYVVRNQQVTETWKLGARKRNYPL